MKKMIVLLFFVCVTLLSISLAYSADDESGGGDGGGDTCPEPLSYALLATGGATLAGARYWLTKRRIMKTVKLSQDVEN